MNELGGVVVLALGMTGVVAGLVAVLRRGPAAPQAPRLTAARRTAPPGRGTRKRDSRSFDTGFDVGVPDPLDFAAPQPVMDQRPSDHPARR